MTRGRPAVTPHGFRVMLAGPGFHAPFSEISAPGKASARGATDGTPVWQLAHDLAARDHDVALVTLDRAATRLVRLRAAGVTITVGPYRDTHRMRDLMRAERLAVRDAIRDLAPDLVHAHWCYEYALGALASGRPTLVTVRDWIPAILRHMDLKYWPYWSGRALMYVATLARARHLTANSPYVADKVKRFTRGALEVVPNGVPDAVFVMTDSSERPAQRPVRPAFISVNNGFSPRKNAKALLRAFSLLRSRHPCTELHLVGDGYGPTEACQRWAEEKRLAEGVVFLGRVPRPELLSSLPRYLALVHPSREESFGMTLVEAMARRVPVVGGALSGAVPWVLRGGRAGLLVDVDDPRDIALAMEALLSDAALREQVAEAGYRHAQRQFTQSRVTAQYLEVYGRVLNEEGRV